MEFHCNAGPMQSQMREPCRFVCCESPASEQQILPGFAVRNDNAGNEMARMLRFALPGDGGLDFAMRETGGDFVADVDRGGIFHQLAVRIEDQGVSAL